MNQKLMLTLIGFVGTHDGDLIDQFVSVLFLEFKQMTEVHLQIVIVTRTDFHGAPSNFVYNWTVYTHHGSSHICIIYGVVWLHE